MAEIHGIRTTPLLPHPVTSGDEIRPDCGHPTPLTCDGCATCTACDGCYCCEAEDEPAHLLAS